MSDVRLGPFDGDHPMKGAAQVDGALPKQVSGGDTDTFLLGVHGAEYADMAVYSIEIPVGRRHRRRTPR